MITVTYGANTNDLAGFEGQNVAAIRAAFSPSYGIPTEAVAVLNGAKASESDVLRAGDSLDFVKATAQKG